MLRTQLWPRLPRLRSRRSLQRPQTCALNIAADTRAELRAGIRRQCPRRRAGLPEGNSLCVSTPSIDWYIFHCLRPRHAKRKQRVFATGPADRREGGVHDRFACGALVVTIIGCKDNIIGHGSPGCKILKMTCHSSKTARASATLSLFYLQFYEGLAGPAETLSLFEEQWVGLSRNPLETFGTPSETLPETPWNPPGTPSATYPDSTHPLHKNTY